VVKGNSHNLMKAGAQRRRTRTEIQQAKLEEQERLRDIEIKMQRFSQMEQELAELQRKQEELNVVEGAVDFLDRACLLRRDASGLKTVDSWEEYEKLRMQREEEHALSESLSQQNQQLQ